MTKKLGQTTLSNVYKDINLHVYKNGHWVWPHSRAVLIADLLLAHGRLFFSESSLLPRTGWSAAMQLPSQLDSIWELKWTRVPRVSEGETKP